jgi:hypothetical protein
MWGLFIAPTSKELEVMNELVAKFWRWEELCSWLEGPGAKIYALFVGSPAGQVRWDDRLDEAIEQLEMGIAERHQVDAELEALRASAILVQDVVLSVIDGPSSLAASLSMAVERLEDWIHTVAANGVHWGT